MTAQSRAPLGALLALALATAFWIPSPGGAAAAPSHPHTTIVVTAASPLVLM